MRRLRWWIVLVVLVFLVFILAPTLVQAVTNWWWFEEIGYQVVFTRQLVTQTLLFLAMGAVTFAVLYVNLRVAQRGVVLTPLVVLGGPSAPRVDVTRVARSLTLPATLLIGLLAGLGATPGWLMVLQALHGTRFGTVDPLFGRDVGFYVFTLPALSALLSYLTTITLFTLLLVAAVYAMRGDVVVRRQAVRVERSAGLHVAVLLAVLLLLVAVRLWVVDTSNLLYSTTGPLLGASYADVHAKLPAQRLSAIVAVAAAVMVLIGGFRERLPRYTLYAVGGYAVVAILGRGLVPAAMEKFVVAPTELTREAPYLGYHIAATRRAWGLDSVQVRELGGEAPLSLADLKANTPTINNVRLWESGPLLQTFRQMQEIRTYYDFISVDDERYWINGQYRQVLLSPRELNPASLPAQTFINQHLTFTHGMGVTVAPVNEVTTEGLPQLFVKDLPPTSSVSLTVTRPQIYYGELDPEYVITATRQREFDYPTGDTDVYTPYAGTGGVPVKSFLRRLLFAARFGTSKILFSGDITDQSKVLYVRRIMDRARQALPFLTFDPDPYLVITADGHLKWILDAYTSSDHYPYSEQLSDGTNYMRNSVKLVIDAYNGTLKAYVATPGDPLIRTWERVFPGIFSPLDSMPADLRAQLRYPGQIFRIQTALYATYHMDSPVSFYHREDQWQIPFVSRATGGSAPFMRRMIMKLPGEAKEEYVYMVPFTPRGKNNLAAWMVARSDGAAYGKLRVYLLPRQTMVFGPTQVESRINQKTEISSQVSLWDQHGSQVLWGDLLVIPIERSLLYIQPLYLQAAGSSIPELKRVVAAYHDQVAMEETLDGALADLFGGTVGTGRSAPLATGGGTAPVRAAAADAALRGLIAQARQHYDAAVAAQRSGDWARYGTELKALGDLLQQIAGSR